MAVISRVTGYSEDVLPFLFLPLTSLIDLAPRYLTPTTSATLHPIGLKCIGLVCWTVK